MIADALDRFAAKLAFAPETGCLLWTAAARPTRCGEGKTGIFKFQGKVWMARRWAAKFIYGHLIEHKEVFTTCGNDLCVRHIRVDYPIINTRQHWLLVNLGYGDDESEDHKRDRLARERREALESIRPEDRGLPEWYREWLGESNAQAAA